MVALEPCHGLESYYRRELLAQWNDAGKARRKRGKEWYPAAREIMESAARESGHTLEQAVAVMAITSPGAQLRTNIEWTKRALESNGAAKVGRFPNVMAPKIRAVLDDPDYAAEYVRGPKVGPFFRAILGDPNELVLDRWALYAAQGSGDRDTNHQLPAGARDAIERAYRNAAKAVRCKVRDFQAAVWIHVRETTPVLRRGKWITPRLADITYA